MTARTFLTALLLCFTSLLNHALAGDPSLSSRADSLKDELRNLKQVFGQRDPNFIYSTSALFKQIDKARDSAESLQRLSGKGYPVRPVSDSLADLDSKMDKLQGLVSYVDLKDPERAIYRNVLVKYRMVHGAFRYYAR